METVLANVGEWVNTMWWLEKGTLVVTVMVDGQQRPIVATTALEAIAAQTAAISQGNWAGKVVHDPETRVTAIHLQDPVACVLFFSTMLQGRDAQIAELGEQIAELSDALLVDVPDDDNDSDVPERQALLGIPAAPVVSRSLGSTWVGIVPPAAAVVPVRHQITMPGGDHSRIRRETIRICAPSGGAAT